MNDMQATPGQGACLWGRVLLRTAGRGEPSPRICASPGRVFDAGTVFRDDWEDIGWHCGPDGPFAIRGTGRSRFLSRFHIIYRIANLKPLVGHGLFGLLSFSRGTAGRNRQHGGAVEMIVRVVVFGAVAVDHEQNLVDGIAEHELPVLASWIVSHNP